MILFLLIGTLVGSLSWFLAWYVTGWSIRVARRHELLAEVNERSSHQTPTPRVGGIGLMAGLTPGLLVTGLFLSFPSLAPGWFSPGVVDYPVTLLVYTGFVIPVVLAFLLGLLDDHRNPPALLKLSLQLLIAAIPPILGLRITSLHFPPLSEPIQFSLITGGVLTFFWVLFVMNAVNFMDGINGIAGRYGQWTGVFTGFGIVALVGSGPLLPLCIGLALASLGFLRYNYPKAATFMGDCGSQALGVYTALLGILVTMIPANFQFSLVGFIIIVSIFLFDVIYTLSKRVLERKNVLRAHREHLYQRFLTSIGEDHLRTLDIVENRMIITGVIGALYLRIATPYGNTMIQTTLLLAAACVLASYWYRVIAAEKNVLTSEAS